ncbi:hypothetical protein ACIRQQ_34105 [Streptomyces fuscichromogenes]|uniref:hypothetical protein n=1 Tax=Streptomyces fuscichromogenes TaxID=1324013 RepID=UPI003814864B
MHTTSPAPPGPRRGAHRAARAEALTVLPALFGRFPRLTLVEDHPFDHVPSFLIHGFREIQVFLG